MAEQRYYWLKFRSDFFDSKRIKKLRNMAGGDTYVIIYLKMQLKSLKTGGVLEYTGIEDQFADELALDLDERPDDVRVTLMFLLQYGLCECSDNIHYFLPWVAENTGSENASAQRVREYRERQKALHCNDAVTELKRIGNAEIDKEKEIDTRKKKDNCPKTDDRFAEFWDEYPRKDKKKETERVFLSLHFTDEKFAEIMDALRRQKRSRQWQDKHYIPMPPVWLRGERWTDEMDDTQPKSKNPALQYEQTPISEEAFNALLLNLDEEEI